MKLEIVWRNPIPPAKGEKRVEPVAVDEFGAVYAVRLRTDLRWRGLGIVARDVARNLGGALWKRQ
jgi:hypothetical protein